MLKFSGFDFLCGHNIECYADFLSFKSCKLVILYAAIVEFYLYPTVSTALVHSVKPKLTE